MLVSAHTSAGKTVVAEYAFAMALRRARVELPVAPMSLVFFGHRDSTAFSRRPPPRLFLLTLPRHIPVLRQTGTASASSTPPL